ncbi:MAG: hypothetical protein K8T91_11750 [Planctomycetes bacterium]|nr:hypothetical protein [Planctomycetota bacterium]
MSSYTDRFLCCGLLTAALASAMPLPAQESPGGVIVVSDGLVRALVARPIEERHSIVQTLMGTYTEGTVIIKGQLDVQFVPSRRSGELELRLRGTATLADAIGYSGPVTVRSSSQTTIDAIKRISLTTAGLQWQPSQVRCSTQIEIQDIEARRRIIERMAWRRAGRMQASVEQAASRQAERQTAHSMDRLADRGLETGSDVLREKMRQYVTMLELRKRLHIRTTEERLVMAMFPSSERPLTMSYQPPVDRQSDGTVVLHEALAGDVSQSLLAGCQVRDDEFLAMMKLLVGDAPRPLWVHARQPRWSVTFAKTRPLDVHFSQGQVRFRMALDRLLIDGKEAVEPMNLEANYALSISADGPVLVRRGPVHLQDESGRTLAEPTAAQQFVGRKLGGVFLPEIRFLGLIPPAGSNWEPLRGLELKELTSENGWLKLSYQLVPNTHRAPLPISLEPQAAR